MPGAVTIRPAIAADEHFLREMLYQALFVPPGKPAFPRAVLAEPSIAHYVDGFGDQPYDTGLVAEYPDGEAVGAAWVRQLTAADPGYGYVDDRTPELTIAVLPDHRGNGVGTRLMDTLLDVVPRCSLSVDERNPALRLYRRLGFVVVARDGHSLTMLRPDEELTAPRGPSAGA